MWRLARCQFEDLPSLDNPPRRKRTLLYLSDALRESFEHVRSEGLGLIAFAPSGTSTSGSEGGEERQPLFVRTRSGGSHWFNTEANPSEQRVAEYRWAGWLMGQCFANRCMMCIPLPELLFVKLLKGSSFQVNTTVCE